MLPGGRRSCTQLRIEGRRGQTRVLDHSTQSWSLSSQMSPASPPMRTTCPSHLALVTRSQIQAPCSGKPGQGQDQAGAGGGAPRPSPPAPSVVVIMSSFTAVFLKKGKKTFCTRAWMLFPLSASKEP